MEQTIKTIEGAAARAFRNVSRIARSDSPTYLLKTYPDTEGRARALAACLGSQKCRRGFVYLCAFDSNKVESSFRRKRSSHERL
jgi:hypothetical protein